MTLVQTYQSFLASPSAAPLAGDAAINYVTTLTTVAGPDAIEKHFVREQKLLKRKREDVLHVIESSNALCLEIDTTIEFVQGGGAYLPGLDDNFLADQVINLPIIHIVQFDANQKIQQVRISWDQGSLLKMVETIGARGKNWPLRDGKDHIRLITKSAGSAPISEISQRMADVRVSSRSQSVSNAMNDPKASLELFAPRDVDAEPETEKVVAPRAGSSAAPTPRDYNELFVEQHDVQERSASPSKGRGKAGAGKNFRESRILDPESVDLQDLSPVKARNERKYQHFEFSDGSDNKGDEQIINEPLKRSNRTNHASQWNFEDFTTPSKPGSRGRVQDQRNFEFGDDSNNQPSPERKPAVHQARKDQQSQFEFQDDGSRPANKARGHPRGVGTMNKDAALYKNLYDEHGVPSTPTGHDNSIANVKDRQKDFGAHWRMTDDATPRAGDDLQSDPRAALQKPNSTTVDNRNRSKTFDSQFEIQDDGPILSEQAGNRQTGTSHAKAVSTMQPNWEATDVSPAGPRTAPGGKENRGVARKGAGQPAWSIGGDYTPENKKIYKTAGNGMGARTGTVGASEAIWGGGEDVPDANVRQGRNNKKSDAWDF